MKRNIQDKDRELIWHPYTQAGLGQENIAIKSAKGAWLFPYDSEPILDAVSSWWVNIHGHANDELLEAMVEQFKKLEQVIFAGFTHDAATDFAQALLAVLPNNQSRFFYSDNGSTAVEVACKMAIQYWSNIGQPKNSIIALEGAYHGDTFGAMSVSSPSAFNKPFEELLFPVHHVSFPVGDGMDTLAAIDAIANKEQIAAIIIEPLIQGSAGMRMYSAEVLEKIVNLAHKHDILVIADEVMTGFGRTGKNFAMDHIKSLPDIMCFSKGITGGVLPMGLTTCNEQIYQAFYSSDRYKTLFHGHSYTGNALTCALAIKSLEILQRDETQERIKQICWVQEQGIERFLKHKLVKEVRVCGTVLAIEIEDNQQTSYFSNIRDYLYSKALEKNILLRPLGNVWYIMPPYCISTEELFHVHKVMEQILNDLQDEQGH